jgi:hypothetical protein
VSKIVAKLKSEFNYDPVNITDMSHKMLDNLRVIALNLRSAQEKDKNERSEENSLIIEFIIQIDQFLKSIP